MKIFSPSNIELYDIQVDDRSVRYRSIMNDDSLTLFFSLPGTVTIPLGSYVDFEGRRYTLFYPEHFKKHNTRNFEYTLTLHGNREILKRFKFKDTASTPYRLKFPLTAKPVEFITRIVQNMNLHDSGWSVGTCVDAPEKLISFNHESCFDVLARLAQEFNTEWEIDGKTIHLRKVEKFKDAPLALSYGKGNGFKSGTGRMNDGDSLPISRLYVQGGERNIDRSKYGSSTLLLPKSATLTYEGKTYRTDADGMYITRDGNENLAEDSYDGTDIYPKRVGTVSDVVVVDADKHFYDIKDSSIPEALNYRDCRIAGEKATIVFQSGILAGREFDIEQSDNDLTGYIHAERRFKIVPQEQDGQIMPGGMFIPAVGDKYAVFNISLPQAYIQNDSDKSGASWDMFREAVRYFAENETQKFQFIGQLDGVWSKSQWLTIGGKIIPGGHVLFSDPQFLPGGEVIRIVSVKDYVNSPHKPEITLSNAPVSGSFAAGLAKLEADEVAIDYAKKDAIRFSQRQWRDARETYAMLQNSMLNFTGSINPLTVQTMQLIAGDESLQFRFVNSKTNPVRVDNPVTFNKTNKQLTIGAGILQHMTLGITSISAAGAAMTYKFWDMSAYTSPPLVEANKPYYLYAKCSKTGSAGTFLLSETAIAMESETGFYHFLIGMLNSEYDGDRSFAQMYGYTEVLPGRVVTDKIVSPSGNTFFDLVNDVISGKITFQSGSSGLTNLAEWSGVAQDIQDAQSAANDAQNTADNAMQAAQDNVTDYNAKFATVQQQIDGEISNWFYAYSPTLSNYPASDWTTNAIRDRHLGDTFTNIQPAPATDAGKSWRFIKSGSVYSWTPIADSDAVKALQQAAQAQSTADGKSTTYLIQPTKYKYGDTWVLGSDWNSFKAGDILTATQDSTYFVTAHWVKRVRYTDDTAVENLEIGGVNLIRNGNFLNELNDWAVNYNPANGETRPETTVITSGSDLPSGVLSALKVVTNATMQGIWQNFFDEGFPKLELDKQYTLSFMLKKEGSGTFAFFFGHQSKHVTREITKVNEWEIHSMTFTPAMHHNIVFYALQASTFYITNIQLERGNKRTAFKVEPFLAEAIGGTTEVNGGLILSHIVAVKDATKNIRAYISGLASKAVAFAAGVTGFGTASESRAVEINHDGSGHLANGNIKWNADGSLLEIVGKIIAQAGKIGGLNIFSDTLKSASMSFTENPIETLASLLTPVTVSTSTTQSNNILNVHAHAYSGTLNLTLDSQVKFRASATPDSNVFDKGYEVYIKDNSGNKVFSQSGAGNLPQTMFTVNLPKGIFSIHVVTTGRFAIGQMYYNSATLLGETSSTIYANGYNLQTKIGNNGFYSFWDSTKYMHYSSSEGLRVKGDTDIPGVLAAGSVVSNGAQSNVWGAKANPTNASPISGGFTVPLSNMSSGNYVVQITPHTNTTFRVGAKTASNFTVYISGGFEYVVIGKN